MNTRRMHWQTTPQWSLRYSPLSISGHKTLSTHQHSKIRVWQLQTNNTLGQPLSPSLMFKTRTCIKKIIKWWGKYTKVVRTQLDTCAQQNLETSSNKSSGNLIYMYTRNCLSHTDTLHYLSKPERLLSHPFECSRFQEFSVFLILSTYQYRKDSTRTQQRNQICIPL